MTCTTRSEFGVRLKKANRLIVAHETIAFPDNVLELLQQNDILFFDDCLYSQYVFLKKNIEQLQQKSITCVLSFSTSIHRISGQPIYHAVCAEQHDKFHIDDMTALQAYMSIDELKELLNYDNVFVACHGDKHLQLEKVNGAISKTSMFILDLSEAVKQMKLLNLQTDIYVYPYAYDEIVGSYACLKKAGFKYMFAGKDSRRTPIECLFSRDVQYTHE